MMRVCGWLGVAIGFGLVGIGNGAIAQIQPDATLGSQQSVLNGNVIEGGAISGSNLLHSFLEFNVSDGQRIDFANPSGITDIFSRVTGSNPSYIFGTLGVLGNANLTLINPNGILFGPNAQLDIRGSFTATTADSIAFSGGYEFSAVNPDAPPLLNIGVPLGLQYGTNPTSGTIINEARLAVETGGDLLLFGHEVRSSGQLVAPGGTVEILGERVALTDHAVVDVSNPDEHSGVAHIGGAWRGEGGVAVAQRTYVGKDAKVMANGGTVGDGGEVVIYGEEMAAFYGEVEARGGDVAGDGGEVEVSGREFLDFRGVVDTAAVNGEAGRLLIDPTIIEVVPSSFMFSPASSLSDVFDGSLANLHGDRTYLDVDAIDSASGMITLAASQDIIFNTAVSNGNQLHLKVEAGRDIEINDSINLSGGTVEMFATTGSIDAQGNPIRTGTLFDDTGKIHLEAEGDITTDILDTSTLGNNAGGVNLISHSGSIDTTDGFVNSAGSNSGGEIIIQANQNITTANIQSLGFGIGAGSITLTSLNGEVDTTAGIIKTGSVSGGGSSGNGNTIQITASNDIRVGDIIAGSEFQNSGQVIIASHNSSIDTSSGNIITSSRTGSSNSITLQAQSDITLGGVLDSSSNSQGGSINITSHNGSIKSQGAVLNSGNLGNRAHNIITGLGVPSSLIPGIDSLETNGGNITLDAAHDIDLNQVAIIASGYSLTNPGNSAIGSGGKVELLTSEAGSITLDNAYIRSYSDQGNGEDIIFKTSSLELDNQTTVAIRAEESAQAGNINITAPKFVGLDNISLIEVQNRSNQPNGDLTIHPTQHLRVSNGSVVSASTVSTASSGGGGVLLITADLIEVIGSDSTGLSPSTLTNYSSRTGTATAGDAGDIIIRAGRLELRDGGNVLASSLGSGSSGNIDIEANSVLIRGTTPSQLLSSGIAADSYDNGQVGNIHLKTQSLDMQAGGVITTSTFGPVSGGNIVIESDTANIQGTSADGQIRSGIYAQSFDTGSGGNILLNINNLQLEDRAKITVSSDPGSPDSRFLIVKSNELVDALRNLPDNNIPASFAIDAGTPGGNAGNLVVNAEHIRLSNLSEMIAETTSGEGGNILLNALCFILLRHESGISTTAGGTGQGGNININTAFLVAPPSENSDITANAFEGPGGSVTVTAFAIYGLEFRPQLTGLSDITVTSTFNTDGVFAFNPLTLIDPTSGLTNLPDLNETPELNASCQTAAGGEQSSFVNTGAGGLSGGPGQLGSHTSIDIPFVALDSTETQSPSDSTAIQESPFAEAIALASCGL